MDDPWADIPDGMQMLAEAIMMDGRECCSRVTGGQCHCGKCHRTFRNLSTFDSHLDVNYRRKPPVLCRDPLSLGLVEDGGTWCTPEGLKARESSRTRLETARIERSRG